MIWNDLKELCNSLPEEQLKRGVILWREDEVIHNIEAKTLQEDYYIGADEVGCYPESEAEDPIEILRKVYSKGDVILEEDF